MNVSDRQLSQAGKAILKKELSFHSKTNPASVTNNRDKICIVKQFLWLATSDDSCSLPQKCKAPNIQYKDEEEEDTRVIL